MRIAHQARIDELFHVANAAPHFHGVTMFQLFVAGTGTLGNRGQELKPLTIQFKDRHTAYGSVTAGPQCLSFVALRMITADSKPVYLENKAEARAKIQLSKVPSVTTGLAWWGWLFS